MSQLQMLKIALIGYVNSMKAVWSKLAYPLSIISKKSGTLKDYRIYGNTVDGQRVGEPTKNLFRYIKGYVQKGAIIEELPTGVIVEGAISSTAATNAWGRGWYTPGYNSASAVCPVLRTGDVITVSADITLLELREGEYYMPFIYLYTRETASGYSSVLYTDVAVGETKKISKTFTIGEANNGYTFYPVFTLNSNVVKIENVQIEYGNVANLYEPYGKYRIGVVARRTSNLFDKNNMNFRTAYIRTASSQYEFSADSSSVLIECQPNTTYTISHSVEGLGVFRACYIDRVPPEGRYFIYDAYAVVQASSSAERTLTVTTGDACTYIVVQGSSAIFDEFVETLRVTVGNPIEEDKEECLNIFLDEPLGNTEYIDYGKGAAIRGDAEETAALPSLPQFKGTTVYEVDTTVKPSGIKVCYYE